MAVLQFRFADKFGKLPPVQNVATPHKFTEAAPLARERFPLAVALSVLFLAALWFGLCRELSGEWSVNEQYNYGWFVPFFALYLFWLRWEDRPPPSPPRKTFLPWIFLGVPTLLLLLPIRLFEIGTPEWRPLGWIHTASVASFAGASSSARVKNRTLVFTP